MSMINKSDYDKLLADCAAITNPTEGQLVLIDPVICKTCAYYIGSWCAEWMGDEWLPQPYARHTEYLATEQQAKEILELWEI